MASCPHAAASWVLVAAMPHCHSLCIHIILMLSVSVLRLAVECFATPPPTHTLLAGCKCTDLLQSLMGIARIEEKRGDMPAALKTINGVHVKHPWFAPALMEKMHLSLAVHGWKETMECVAQLQQKDASNVLAFAYHGAAPVCLSVTCPSPNLRCRLIGSWWQ